MIIKAGEFWLAEIQYTNGTAAKQRPVLKCFNLELLE